ncbi:hypothetical protein [Deminuibacter soli]|uniref:Uncharacterized protein n=1 Tax=Deminuibacter soli TaxID=2291815 RepID=A0A3E1NP00_9BACT|nr:hypothetical protein [Deminuibacter soli]RFM29661.1 hypothetical protein DXN05_01375 [Deminuibacter soli]
MKKNSSSTRFVVTALLLIGVAWSALALYYHNYWMLTLGALWLLMPFTISFSYTEEEDAGSTNENSSASTGSQNDNSSHFFNEDKVHEEERKNY